MRIITLVRGQNVIVDADLFEELNKYRWFLANDGYARRTKEVAKIDGKRVVKAYLMHREVLGTPRGMITDHINGNKLDNRKANLRVCTRSENAMNRSTPSHNISGYKCIHWLSREKRWCVAVTGGKKKVHVGTYKNISEAVLARDLVIQQLHGGFARLD